MGWSLRDLVGRFLHCRRFVAAEEKARRREAVLAVKFLDSKQRRTNVERDRAGSPMTIDDAAETLRRLAEDIFTGRFRGRDQEVADRLTRVAGRLEQLGKVGPRAAVSYRETPYNSDWSDPDGQPDVENRPGRAYRRTFDLGHPLARIDMAVPSLLLVSPNSENSVGELIPGATVEVFAHENLRTLRDQLTVALEEAPEE